MTDPALVIGAGPAGLMAAQALTDAGLRVVVADAKPSLGRKFLMAGKSGLNLTKDEPNEAFSRAFFPETAQMSAAVAAFGPREAMAWAESLGQTLFTGSSGRVFPTAMKASPLLRAWSARLEASGAVLQTKWIWRGWEGAASVFETPGGITRLTPSVTVLAMGGASWRRLGSDGAWAQTLGHEGVPLEPFRPANIGVQVAWTPPMIRHFGAPVKGILLKGGNLASRGEIVISHRGIEGGGIYSISRAIRDGARLEMDLLPDLRAEMVERRLSAPQGKSSLSNYLRKALRLPSVKVALLREFGHPMPEDPAARAKLIKSLPVRHLGPRPMDEAISVAGGVAWSGLTEDFMLRAKPGVFCAGEMLDWEAPTGGYLITGCLATGRWAGRAAANWAKSPDQ